ncbi:MAG: hypothetical protein ACKOA9_06550 [Actinomycetota bacterium]
MANDAPVPEVPEPVVTAAPSPATPGTPDRDARAPSTEALDRLEAELAALEDELAALEAADGSDA